MSGTAWLVIGGVVFLAACAPLAKQITQSVGHLPPRRVMIGVVCHRMLDADVQALRGMGVRAVRLSLYPNGDGAAWIDRAIQEGFDVTIVTYRDAAARAGDKARWPSAHWQVGNEPAWPQVSPQSVAQGAAWGDVSPGLAHGTPLAWVQQYSQAAPPFQVLALHAYGEPLLLAVQETAALAPSTRRLWLTEIGSKDPNQLAGALRVLDGNRVERAYVYALYSPADGYTLTPAHQDVIRRYIAGSL
jgi:hypothetical protein